MPTEKFNAALSMPVAAKTAGIGLSTLYRHLVQNDGPRVTRIGGRTLVLTNDLEAWLQEKREATTTGGK
jgi:predicted DNA-binding transcriptional regulator AlpA